jgi:hypothetical protein
VALSLERGGQKINILKIRTLKERNNFSLYKERVIKKSLKRYFFLFLLG